LLLLLLLLLLCHPQWLLSPQHHVSNRQLVLQQTNRLLNLGQSNDS
jgi:hypothetical protein